MFRLIFLFIILLFSNILYASSPEEKKLEKVSVQLNWKYQFEFAGFIAAKELGYYKDVGLDVEIREFDQKTNVISDVINYKADFGVYDASLVRAYTKEKPIVLLSNYFKRSALVFITNQDILTPEDLVGKKIMAAQDELENSSLGALLKKFNIGIDKLDLIPHSYSAKEFINGSVDVMTAFISNEIYDVKKAKIPYNVIDPVNYGMYGLGLNLFTTLDKTKQNRQQVENFMIATNKGWKYALENKKQIVDLIYEKYSQIKSRDSLMFEAEETQKLMMPKTYPIGSINKDILENTINNLIVQNIIPKNLKAEDLLFYKDKNQSNTLFTQKQKEYLQNKKEITMCIDPDWMPYERIHNGQHEGMTLDYMNILQEKIGIPIKLIPTKTWDESIEFAKKRKCDIFSLAMSTPSRLKYMNFTQPYLDFPIVVATKVDKLFVAGLDDIINTEKLGIVKGYSMGEILRSKYPQNKIVDVDSVEAGMELVKQGKIFGFIGSLPTVAYSLQHKYISELKIAGKFEYKLELGIGTRNDEVELFEVFEKAIDSISLLKRQEILNKYISVKFERGFDYDLFWKASLILVVLIVIGVYRHKQVLKYNQKLTEQKNKLNHINSELQHTKDKLQISVNSFEILLNSVMEAIMVYEKEICTDVNNVAVGMFGYESKEEMIGLSIDKFAHKESLKLVKSKFKKDVTPYEVKGIKKDGEVFDILVQGRNTTMNGKSVRISTVVDITDMKKQERLVFQQSKMAAMGEMIDNIAHQWRQPLNLISTVSTGLELKLEYDTFDKKDGIENLNKLNKTAQHLSQTINDFRDFFKENKEISEFSILEVLNKNLSLIEGMLKAYDINIIFEKTNDVAIKSYENELTQALLNIFNNAKDILITISSEKYIFINVTKDAEILTITITDNAGGISDKNINKIFEPYFTTKHQSQGTGIGLYMTHQIIESHMKGSIKASNKVFKYNDIEYTGAQFIIKLPLAIT